MTTRYFLGVDGGGTKTDFICIDGSDAIAARAVTGTTYHLEVGLEEAVRRLAEGIGAVCGQVGIDATSLDFAFFGLPGFGEDANADPRLITASRQLLGHQRFQCDNDMVCGWAGSLGCEDGINIVAGTGSIGYGEREGLKARAGGWGEIFGDEGSAYWIAVRGLALVSRMSDGRAPKDLLYHSMREVLGLTDDLDLCARIMGPTGMSRGEIAGLAGIVSDAAMHGDQAALAILEAAAGELAELAVALRTKLRFPAGLAASVSWSGGVLSREPLVRQAFVAALERVGDFLPTPPRFDPGYGAALYAQKLARLASIAT